MLVEAKPIAPKMLSTRTDDETFYALKALSQVTGVGVSVIMRLAISSLILKARENQPTSWTDLKNIVKA